MHLRNDEAEAPHEASPASRDCPACGQRTDRTLIRQSRLLFRCDNCGLQWLALQPGPRELAELYESGFYSSEEPRATLVVRVLHAVNNRLRLRELRGIPPGRLLDVGCGKGRFLSTAERAGWDVVGVEFSSAMADHARSLGLHVEQGDFLTMDLDGSFDVVTMWHVLEHLPDPRRAVARARELLEPGGRLVVSVPNIESAQARLGGGNWFHLDLPRHLFHFSPRAVVTLLERHRFAIERVGYFYPEMEAVGLVETVANAAGVERDALYRFLKGERHLSPGSVALAGLVGVASLPAAAVWTPAAAALRVGASIQVVATAR
jgi:SAM-dependent methyltransferase